MKSTGTTCSLLLLTMAAVTSGRNAEDYFEEARFQHSPSRPEDALVFFVANAPPFICEPEKNYECTVGDPLEAGFCLRLPHGYSHYTCSFEGNETMAANFDLIKRSVPRLFDFSGGRFIEFRESTMYCTTDSQLPDEYFRLRVQRPHEDHPVKCLLRSDSGILYLRFPGYPTILCQLGIEEGRYLFQGRYRFNVPGIADDPLKCVFRVYSELPLVDTHTEERLYQSLISGIPDRMDGVRPRVVCSRHAATNASLNFQLLLQRDVTYNCNFPDDTALYPPEPQDTTGNLTVGPFNDAEDTL